MSQLIAVALNTFREAIRNRVFASLILFAIAMLLLTLAVSSASLNQEIRLVKDIGLFLTSTFSVLIAVFVGVNLVYKEIERKTVYTVMPKPIFRFQFLFGKYLGVLVTMFIQIVVMGLVLYLLFWILDAQFKLEMVQALWLVFVEVMIVSAVALVFSSFSTPFLSGLFTCGIFVLGRFADRLSTIKLAEQGKETDLSIFGERLSHTISYIVPDLSQLNVTEFVIYEAPLTWSHVLHATLYGMTYAALALLIAGFLFSHRDFV